MRKAAGATIAFLGAAALVTAWSRPAADRGAIADGLVTSALAYERSLALIGVGIAAARQTTVVGWGSILMLAAGLMAGSSAESELADAIFVADHLVILAVPGSIACILAGLGLALPEFLQRWLLPLVAAASGALLGLANALAAPAADRLGFIAGGAAASIWLALVPLLIFSPFRAAWSRIVVKIVGSWLIAIGVMLLGTRLMAAKPPELPPPHPASQTLSPSAAPEAIPPPAAVEGPPRDEGGESPAP